MTKFGGQQAAWADDRDARIRELRRPHQRPRRHAAAADDLRPRLWIDGRWRFARRLAGCLRASTLAPFGAGNPFPFSAQPRRDCGWPQG
jgi:hypothetical protein